MNLVLFSHPDFLRSTSQPRFAAMLRDAFVRRGHRVELRRPVARVRRLAPPGSLAKWAGYVDQYLLFPPELRRAVAQDPKDTLYVFCDQALGPWIPAVAERPHVVHCHDLLALLSALGQVPENPTGPTGRLYQRYIRAGFRRARHFISISEKSRADLHRFGGVQPETSEVVYNGLNHPYRRQTLSQARATLRAEGLELPAQGILLHVGGGQWYKNTAGLLHLYACFARQREAAAKTVPALWLVSPPAGASILPLLAALPEIAQVRFLQGLGTPVLEALYSTALAMLFPSLAEGFGWPIAEALACGCPVITTGEAPMTEVGGPVAHYLPRLRGAEHLDVWASHGADALATLLARPAEVRETAAQAGIAWARRFDAERAIDAYLRIYQDVLERS
jgi:glycosyltransferase involved in cell wall biosynthesis